MRGKGDRAGAGGEGKLEGDETQRIRSLRFSGLQNGGGTETPSNDTSMSQLVDSILAGVDDWQQHTYLAIMETVHNLSGEIRAIGEEILEAIDDIADAPETRQNRRREERIPPQIEGVDWVVAGALKQNEIIATRIAEMVNESIDIITDDLRKRGYQLVRVGGRNDFGAFVVGGKNGEGFVALGMTNGAASVIAELPREEVRMIVNGLTSIIGLSEED